MKVRYVIYDWGQYKAGIQKRELFDCESEEEIKELIDKKVNEDYVKRIKPHIFMDEALQEVIVEKEILDCRN